MATAVVILAVALALVLLVAVAFARRSWARGRQLTELSASSSTMAAELDELRTTTLGRQHALEETVASLTQERDSLGDRLSAAEAERARLQASLEENAAEVASITEELVQRDADLLHARAAVFEAETAAAAAMGRAGESRAELEKALAELAGVRNELAEVRAHGSGPEGSRPEAAPLVVEALWALERARVERTWRQSVATDPTDPSPFTQGGDPARVAVEIEVAAIREEVGSDLATEWQIGEHLPVGDGLLVVRAAQELLATASRTVEQATLVVAREGTSVRLSIGGADGAPIALSGLVDLSVVPGSRVDGAALVVPLSA